MVICNKLISSKIEKFREAFSQKNVESWASKSTGKWCENGAETYTLNCFEVGRILLPCIGLSDFRSEGSDLDADSWWDEGSKAVRVGGIVPGRKRDLLYFPIPS